MGVHSSDIKSTDYSSVAYGLSFIFLDLIPNYSPEIDLSSGSPMRIQGGLLLTLSLLMVAELIMLAALGPRQLLCQEDDSIVVDAQKPCSTHS